MAESRIIGWHQDEEKFWVADLDCGHGRHFRHNPPWTSRPWVMTGEGRQQLVGSVLDCLKCDNEAGQS